MALTGLAVTGCGQTVRATGWTARDGSTAVSRLELARISAAITVGIELPPGYEAAEDFIQRATLRLPDGEQTDTQSGLDRAFRLELPAGGANTGELEVMLGFCESDRKEVCYVDTATLPVSRREAAGDTETLVYRPEPPK